MNSLEKLLGANPELLKKPTKEIEIKRLSEALGEKFVVEVKAINMTQFKSIIKESKEMEDDVQLSSLDAAKISVKLGMINPRVTDKSLQKHFNCKTWEDLLDALFLTGEIMKISESIMELSQLTEEERKEIKKK